MKYHIVKAKSDIDTLCFIPTICIGFYKSNIKKTTLDSTLNPIKERFPSIDFMLCSSEDNISNETPYINQNYNIIFVLFDFKKEHYHLKYMPFEKEAIYNLAKDINLECYQSIIFSTFKMDISEELFILKEILGKSNIFGALAGEAPDDKNNVTIYHNGDMYDSGFLILLLSKEYYTIDGVGVHSFEPIGFNLNVTKSIENRVFEIEGEKALDIVEDIMGNIDSDSRYLNEYPFYISDNFTKKNKSILSSIKSIDKDSKSLEFFRRIYPNSSIQPAVSIAQYIQDRRVYKLKKNIKKDTFYFLFLCIKMKEYLSVTESTYIHYIFSQTTDSFLGFHTFGEISPNSYGKESFHQNQTITVVGLKKRSRDD